MENLVDTFLSLGPEAFSVLGSIETGMRDHDWVPNSDAACFSALPMTVALTKHDVTMEPVNGDLLNQVTLINPEGSPEIILGELKDAFHLDIINSDVSKFNINIHNSGTKIIDWPQAIDSNHPSALEKLERDVSTILGFFESKNKVRMIIKEVLNYVRTPATEACQ